MAAMLVGGPRLVDLRALVSNCCECQHGPMANTPGPLLLLGGAPFGSAPPLDRAVVDQLSSTHLVVIPTASAYGHPERELLAAAEALSPHDITVEGLMVLSHSEANAPEMAERLQTAESICLTDGSALHLKSVLKGTPLLEALITAWQQGATLIGVGAGAMVLTDPMVDPRGGALTTGLGLVESLAVVSHLGDMDQDPEGQKFHRTVALAASEILVLGLAADAGVAISPTGELTRLGEGRIEAYKAGEPVQLFS